MAGACIREEYGAAAGVGSEKWAVNSNEKAEHAEKTQKAAGIFRDIPQVPRSLDSFRQRMKEGPRIAQITQMALQPFV
jgi:hypothetical protein